MAQQNKENAIYNSVADTYDADFLGVNAQARGIVLSQIKNHVKESDRILDVCIGTGQTAVELGKIFHFHRFIGCDISDKMIEQAKKKIPFSWTVVCDDCRNLEQYIEPGSQDLILCHLLNDFVPLEALLPLFYRLLKPGGYLSNLGSTKQQCSAAPEIFQGSLLARLFYKKVMKESLDAAILTSGCLDSHLEGIELMKQHRFAVIDEQEKGVSIVLDSAKESWKLAYEAGWANRYLSSLSPWQLRLIKLCLQLFQLPLLNIYPLKFRMLFSCILAQKPL